MTINNNRKPSGIGREFAKVLAAHGHNVVVSDTAG
jgi:NAD(P)-dependent dehydrogenase (short-subunit alcohol dehydrogenase family)